MNELAVEIAEILNGKKVHELTDQEAQIASLIPDHLGTKGRGKKEKLAKTSFAVLERQRIWQDTMISLGK